MHKFVKDRHNPQQLTDLLRNYKTTLTLMNHSITKIFQLHSSSLRSPRNVLRGNFK